MRLNYSGIQLIASYIPRSLLPYKYFNKRASTNYFSKIMSFCDVKAGRGVDCDV